MNCQNVHDADDIEYWCYKNYSVYNIFAYTITSCCDYSPRLTTVCVLMCIIGLDLSKKNFDNKHDYSVTTLWGLCTQQWNFGNIWSTSHVIYSAKL